jgi:septal ring factor EnvC (AmiA/AmiB activator)
MNDNSIVWVASFDIGKKNFAFYIEEVNEEQLKQINERKLVEESDNHLTNNLFSTDEQLLNKNQNLKSIQNDKKKELKKKPVNNQKLNEEKQKLLSKTIKQQKAIKQREKELFGEIENSEYDKYTTYEENFY